MIELTLVVTAVVLTSATCSLFEATLYSVSASHVETLVQKGRRSGKLLKAMRDKIDAPITAILSLNTISNTAGAAVAGAIAVRVLGAEWLIYFSVAFTAIILFFSEVLPKTIGVVYAKTLSTFIATPLYGLVILFKPLVWLCGLGTNLISAKQKKDGISPEELIVMAHLATQAGSIDQDEADVIKNILAVRSKTVNEVMTPRSVLFTLPSTLTIEDALKDKGIYSYTRVPVYGDDREDIVGIVFRRSVLSAVAEKRTDADLTTLMRPPHFVLETMRLNKTLKEFLRLGEHMFIVIDEFGGLAGVVTLEDVLEEILGKEIVDEFDEVTDMRELAHKRRDELLKSGPRPPGTEKP